MSVTFYLVTHGDVDYLATCWSYVGIEFAS